MAASSTFKYFLGGDNGLHQINRTHHITRGERRTVVSWLVKNGREDKECAKNAGALVCVDPTPRVSVFFYVF